jgi:hypothetical protein
MIVSHRNERDSDAPRPLVPGPECLAPQSAIHILQILRIERADR